MRLPGIVRWLINAWDNITLLATWGARNHLSRCLFCRPSFFFFGNSNNDDDDGGHHYTYDILLLLLYTRCHLLVGKHLCPVRVVWLCRVGRVADHGMVIRSNQLAMFGDVIASCHCSVCYTHAPNLSLSHTNTLSCSPIYCTSMRMSHHRCRRSIN